MALHSFIDGDAVYAVVPVGSNTIRMSNLSTSNHTGGFRKTPDGKFYIIETVAPVDDCFLDFPLLTAEEARKHLAELELEETSSWWTKILNIFYPAT